MLGKDIVINENDLIGVDFDASDNTIKLYIKNDIAMDNIRCSLFFKKNNTDNLPKKYIINNNATILLWKDGTKTIVKRAKEDEYNKTLSFLWAYFQKTSGLSKTKANKYIKGLLDENELKILKFSKDGTFYQKMADFADELGKGFKNLSKTFLNNCQKNGITIPNLVDKNVKKYKD